MLTKKGFTLIELLIVVAIIAILAAIAVPNFLEAQTRSKVSRSKADLRSLATALEAYAVDQNAYPTYHYTPLVAGTDHFIGGWLRVFAGYPQITTPVAFITSMPFDPFFVLKANEEPEQRNFVYVNWKIAVEQLGFDPALRRFYGEWRLIGSGPLQTHNRLSYGIPYDPTNGTISSGLIWRCQKDSEAKVYW